MASDFTASQGGYETAKAVYETAVAAFEGQKLDTSTPAYAAAKAAMTTAEDFVRKEKGKFDVLAKEKQQGDA